MIPPPNRRDLSVNHGGITDDSRIEDELRVGGIPPEWKELLKARADELTLPLAALVRMILGDWINQERRRRKGEGRQ